jgi:hypothetical protein
MGLLQKIDLRLYVIDGSGDWVDWLDSLFTIGDIKVVSVADMAKKVLELVTRSGRKIENLFIGGHGHPGFQGLGCGSGGDSTGAKSLQVDSGTGALLGTAGVELGRIRPYFNNTAIVTLGGCQVAAGSEGQALLKAVSTALGGIRVQAGTADQRPFLPGMEGSVVRCTPDNCQTLSGGWWGTPGSWIN